MKSIPFNIPSPVFPQRLSERNEDPVPEEHLTLNVGYS